MATRKPPAGMRVRDDDLRLRPGRIRSPRAPKAKGFVAQLSLTEEGRATVARVQRLIHRSEYKRRQAPPMLRLRPRAFGTGRQMPIAAHYA